MDLLPGLESVQNIHPLFVHFPVASILLALLFEGVWLMTRKDHLRIFATYLLYVSAVSAIAAVVTGYIAADSLGHDAPGHDFVHEHRDLMLWMSGVLLLTTLLVLFIRTLREGKARRFLIVVFLVISGLLVYGADKGGRLVFEYGMGVKATSAEATPEGKNDEQTPGVEMPAHHGSSSNSTTNLADHSDEHNHSH